MKCIYCGFSAKFAGRMQIRAKTWYEEKEVYTCIVCKRNTVKIIVRRSDVGSCASG